MKLTITTKELRDLVSPVLPLAGIDDTFPVLMAVLIQKRGDWLTATATDRYRAGVSRIKARDGQEDFSVLLATADVKRILALFKPTRMLDAELVFTVSGDASKERAKCTVESAGGLIGMLAAQVTFYCVDGEFPKVNEVVAGVLKAESDLTGRVNLSAAFLADFKAAVRGVEPLRLSMGKANANGVPVPIIRCGDHFLGLLMPVASQRAPEYAVWDDVFPVQAEEQAGEAA